MRCMFRSDLLFAITINGINVITCSIENYDQDNVYNAGAVKVKTSPSIVNKPVKEGSIINIKSLAPFYFFENDSVTFLVTILLELDPL